MELEILKYVYLEMNFIAFDSPKTKYLTALRLCAFYFDLVKERAALNFLYMSAAQFEKAIMYWWILLIRTPIQHKFFILH